MWRPFLSSLFTFSPASVFFLKVALSSTIENGLLGKVPLFSTEAWILRNIEAESESWGRRSRRRIMVLQSQVMETGYSQVISALVSAQADVCQLW